MVTTTAKLATLAAAWALWAAIPAAADPGADSGDIQHLTPPPSQAALDARFTALVEQIPGMHVINDTITDNGGRMVCVYLDRHSREDTTADLLQDNPTFTAAESDAFVNDAMTVYCPSQLKQTIS
jgi:hypothetical protein